MSVHPYVWFSNSDVTASKRRIVREIDFIFTIEKPQQTLII